MYPTAKILLHPTDADDEWAMIRCCGSGDANWIAGKEAWKKECEADPSVLRLLATNRVSDDLNPVAGVSRRQNV